MTQAFIDTDVIIRYLTGDDSAKQAAANDLFEQLDQGLITIAAPDTVIADAVHVLSSRRLYNIPRDEIYELLSPLLRLTHFKVENATNVLRALEVYATHKLETVQQFMFEGMFHKHFQLLYTIFNSPGTRRLFAEKECALRDLWAQLADRVTALIEEGKAAGEFAATIPTPVMLSAFFNLLSPKGYERLLREEKMSPEEVVKQLGRIYFNGIAKE